MPKYRSKCLFPLQDSCLSQGPYTELGKTDIKHISPPTPTFCRMTYNYKHWSFLCQFKPSMYMLRIGLYDGCNCKYCTVVLFCFRISCIITFLNNLFTFNFGYVFCNVCHE